MNKQYAFHEAFCIFLLLKKIHILELRIKEYEKHNGTVHINHFNSILQLTNHNIFH